MNNKADSTILADEVFSAPVETPRISDLIAERIARAIRDGKLQPGERLPTEHQLARQLDVGRTSVREGLQRLRALGLVEVRKGLGAHVATALFTETIAQFVQWTATQGVAIEELLEVRIALETLAAALAAVHSETEDVATLRRAHKAHVDAAKATDLAELVHTDEAFHEAVMAASRNQFVGRMYSVLIGELTDFRRRTLALPWAPTRSFKGHAAILAAIDRRDPAEARGAMLRHLYVLYTEVGESLKKHDSEASCFRLAPLRALG